MVVCLCSGSSETEIERAIDDGAESLADVGRACRAGLDCGACRSELVEMLDRRRCDGCSTPGMPCREAELRVAAAG